MSSQPSDILNKIQKQKKIMATLEQYFKKYQKYQKTNLNETILANQVLDAIERKLPEVSSPELKNEIDDIISLENTQNQSLLNHYEKLFGNELNSELIKLNLKLEGRSPKYKTNYYGIEIDIHKNICKIYYGFNEEYIGSEKLDPKLISDYIYNYENSILTNKIDPSLFKKTYDTLVLQQRGDFKQRIPIIKLLTHLAVIQQNTKFESNPTKSNYKSYSRIQFSHDIYMIKRDNKLKIKLITANRAQVKNKNTYLWIPVNQTMGSVYSYIEITEDN
jgi:hypothetical protein